ncbi:hypothetical protein MTO96_024653 [Rhipicephalus appendiculatus]
MDGSVDPGSAPSPMAPYDPVLAAANVRQRVRKSRYWVPTDLGRVQGGSGGSGGGLVFTVMSGPCADRISSTELREINADILCLQELQQDHYETDFKPELEKMGYGCLYKQRTGDKRDGCGIFFRKSVFELDCFEPIEYARSDVTVLDRDNVALIAMLKPVAGNAMFGADFRLCVSTTHLLFNPRRGDIKLAQLCLLLAEIDRLAFRGDSSDGKPLYFPILLCGDMNRRVDKWFFEKGLAIKIGDEQFCEGLTSGKPPVRDAAPATDSSNANGSTPAKESRQRVVRHFLNLISAYKHNVKGANAEVTTHHQRASCTVDYIFYSVKRKDTMFREGQVKHACVVEGPLRLLATYRLMSQSQLVAVGGLPNEVQSSDHLPLDCQVSA